MVQVSDLRVRRGSGCFESNPMDLHGFLQWELEPCAVPARGSQMKSGSTVKPSSDNRPAA
jgi:hypothetical protein